MDGYDRVGGLERRGPGVATGCERDEMLRFRYRQWSAFGPREEIRAVQLVLGLIQDQVHGTAEASGHVPGASPRSG